MFYVFLAVSSSAHLTDKDLLNICSANTNVLKHFSAGLWYMRQCFASSYHVSDSWSFLYLILCCCLRLIGMKKRNSCEGGNKMHSLFFTIIYFEKNVVKVFFTYLEFSVIKVVSVSLLIGVLPTSAYLKYARTHTHKKFISMQRDWDIRHHCNKYCAHTVELKTQCFQIWITLELHVLPEKFTLHHSNPVYADTYLAPSWQIRILVCLWPWLQPCCSALWHSERVTPALVAHRAVQVFPFIGFLRWLPGNYIFLYLLCAVYLV